MKLVQRVDFIKGRCSGKNFLNFGCAKKTYTKDSIENDMLLHFDLEKTAGELHGFDFDQAGLDILSGLGRKNLYRADLEKLDDVPLAKTFDVIVAGEMVEHLNNVGMFLEGIKRFMNADTLLLLTTINAYCGMRFIQYGLRGKKGIQEPVHPDHVAYYSYSTLSVLLQRYSLTVDEFLFYDIGMEHRPHNKWYLNAINDVCTFVAPQWADGIIAVCRLSEQK